MLLSLLFLPFFCILPLFAIEWDSKNNFIKKIILNFSILIFFYSLIFWLNFNNFYGGSFQFLKIYKLTYICKFLKVFPAEWLKNIWLINILNFFPKELLKFVIGVDGISLFFLLLTTFLMPLCILASWEYKFSNYFEEKVFFLLLLILEGALIGTFISLDLIFFFIFFEITLIPLYFLIGIFLFNELSYNLIFF